VAGVALLGRAWGIGVALALTLLPGALLTRAKNPSSALARLIALAGAVAVACAYWLPHAGGVSVARQIIDDLRGDPDFVTWVRAIFFALPIPLCVVALFAVVPRRTRGGCVLWASLLLLWAPVSLLVTGWWIGLSVPVGLAVLALAGASAGALGLADLSTT
jgi:hypothetical protein